MPLEFGGFFGGTENNDSDNGSGQFTGTDHDARLRTGNIDTGSFFDESVITPRDLDKIRRVLIDFMQNPLLNIRQIIIRVEDYTKAVKNITLGKIQIFDRLRQKKTIGDHDSFT